MPQRALPARLRPTLGKAHSLGRAAGVHRAQQASPLATERAEHSLRAPSGCLRVLSIPGCLRVLSIPACTQGMLSPFPVHAGTLGPFPDVIGRYEPFSGNTFMGSRVFPSGASIDSLSTYQTTVY